jgi:hypothetical protein
VLAWRSEWLGSARPVCRGMLQNPLALFLQQLRDALEGVGWLPLVLFGVRQIFRDAAVDPSTVAIFAQRRAKLVQVEHGFPLPVKISCSAGVVKKRKEEACPT